MAGKGMQGCARDLTLLYNDDPQSPHRGLSSLQGPNVPASAGYFQAEKAQVTLRHPYMSLPEVKTPVTGRVTLLLRRTDRGGGIEVKYKTFRNARTNEKKRHMSSTLLDHPDS